MTSPEPRAARVAAGLLGTAGVSRLYAGGASAALHALAGTAAGGEGGTVSVREHDGTTEVRASIGTDGAAPAVDVALDAVAAVREALGPGEHRVTIRIASVG